MDHYYLYRYGEYEDENEHGVVEEVLEDVELALAQLPCVDLIENLAEDEHLENDRVQSDLLGGLILNPSHLGRSLRIVINIILSRIEGVVIFVVEIKN